MRSMNIRQNAFDLLRYYSAFGVMLLHFSGLYMMKEDLFINRVLNTAATWYTPVVILFMISGFLIPPSFERSAGSADFLKKRFLRIYPPIWLMCIINALTVILFRPDILSERGFYLWTVLQALGLAWTPECLKDFATGSGNGAFWSISVLLQFYLAAGLFLPYLARISKKKWKGILFLSAFINLFLGYFVRTPGGAVYNKLLERTILPYAFYFLAGMYLYFFREDTLPVLKKAFPYLMIIYIPYRLLVSWQAGYYTDPGRAVFTILTAAAAAFVLPSARVKTDVTYELYLYHWIILNILTAANVYRAGNWFISLFLFLVLSVVTAFLAKSITDRVLSRFSHPH